MGEGTSGSTNLLNSIYHWENGILSHEASGTLVMNLITGVIINREIINWTQHGRLVVAVPCVDYAVPYFQLPTPCLVSYQVRPTSNALSCFLPGETGSWRAHNSTDSSSIKFWLDSNPAFQQPAGHIQHINHPAQRQFLLSRATHIPSYQAEEDWLHSARTDLYPRC